MKTNPANSSIHETTNHGDTCHEILVPVDFSPASVSALRQAASLAEENHAHVTVLGVIADRAYYRGLEVPLWQKHREKNLCQRMELLVDHELRNVEKEVVVLSGEPATEICRLARKSQADLIILGLHDDADPHALFAEHHPISRKVTETAPCRVLVTETGN